MCKEATSQPEYKYRLNLNNKQSVTQIAYLFQSDGRMGFVGLGMRCRRFHNFSKSSRNWCEKTTSPATKIRQSFEFVIPMNEFY